MQIKWNFVGLLALLAALFVMLALWAPRKAHPAEAGPPEQDRAKRLVRDVNPESV